MDDKTTEDKKPMPRAAGDTPKKSPDAITGKARLGDPIGPGARMPVEGIGVALVRWDRQLQLPGKNSESAMKTERLPNGNSYAVMYIPAWRHFRVEYIDAVRKKEPQVAYVPECRALSWDPL